MPLSPPAFGGMCPGGEEGLVGVTYKSCRASSTTGRIAMGARAFIHLRGYREDFNPMGFQDVDVSRRLSRLGQHVRFESDADVGNAFYNCLSDLSRKEW